MTTKKQENAENRIARSKQEKSTRFANFLMRLARRHMKDPAGRRVNLNFCCRPNSLGMPRDQLMAKGQQLVGGKAAFFDRGELKALLSRRWDCQNRGRPTILLKSYIEGNYDVNGEYKDPYYDTSRDDWA